MLLFVSLLGSLVRCSAVFDHHIPSDDRVAGGLWGLFVADALAMPVHWYYGGPDQIRQNYGGSLLSGYQRAVHPYPQTIMQLSNTGGGGRGGDEGDIIGGVILHDKKTYWKRGGNYHYHHTLQAGENTLEASLVRLLIRSAIENNGHFSADLFRSKYVEFMTTPATHNDTYASTCHRMFFKNWHAGTPADKCPDNDGLVLPSVVLLSELAAGRPVAEASALAAEVSAVTRRSSKLGEYIDALAALLGAVFGGSSIETAIDGLFPHIAQEVKRRSGQNDPMTACYIDGSFPALLFFGHKYAKLPVSEALLASANAGGENVHRGSVLGSLLGASAGADGISIDFQKGLVAHSELQKEVAELVALLRTRREKAAARAADL